jgi:hypothetical protein
LRDTEQFYGDRAVPARHWFQLDSALRYCAHLGYGVDAERARHDRQR